MRKAFLVISVPLALAAPALSAESTETVRAIEQELAAHGYSPGVADGELDERTRGAIRDYQRDAGLPSDGQPSRQLLDHLRSPETRVHPKGVQARQAAVPQDVIIRSQEALKSRGYYQGRMDGHVGPEMEQAARRFRADAGLPKTGRIDGSLLDQLRTADPSIRAPRS